MTLIITVVVIIILASITIFNGLDTFKRAQEAKAENEFKDVCNFVRTLSGNLEAGLLDTTLTKDTLATDEQINSMYVDSEESQLTPEEVNIISNVNETAVSTPDRGYHYITAKQIEYGIPGIDADSSLSNVGNDYIINFYYGVVISRVSEEKTLVSGIVR